MSYSRKFIRVPAGILVFFALALSLVLSAQEKPADANAKPDADAKASRLTIVVTAGEDKKPVDGASVYIRFVEEHKHGKDKKVEMNLKTNQEGVCHIPVIPPGNFLVQVIAEGWKTYGEYYDPTKVDQAIQINLTRPPKWY